MVAPMKPIAPFGFATVPSFIHASPKHGLSSSNSAFEHAIELIQGSLRPFDNAATSLLLKPVVPQDVWLPWPMKLSSDNPPLSSAEMLLIVGGIPPYSGFEQYCVTTMLPDSAIIT